jgi:Flp pilus assembly pilin Flp
VERRRGQATVEYIVIVGLIAIAVIPAVSKLADGIRASFQKSTKALDDRLTHRLGTGGGGGGGSLGGGGGGGLFVEVPDNSPPPKPKNDQPKKGQP